MLSWIYLPFLHWLLQKWKEWSAALEKNTKLSPETKEQWLSVVTNDFMSSEESDGDHIIIHSLPWRSVRVDDIKSKIDGFIKKHKTSQAQRQMKECRVRTLWAMSTTWCTSMGSLLRRKLKNVLLNLLLTPAHSHCYLYYNYVIT